MRMAWGFWDRRPGWPSAAVVPPSGPVWRPITVGLPFRPRAAAWVVSPRVRVYQRGGALAILGACILAAVIWAARQAGPAVVGQPGVAQALAGPTGLPGGPAPTLGVGPPVMQVEAANASRELAALVPPVPAWDTAIVRSAAQAAGLPAALVAAVIYEESRGDPLAVSPAGAKGLMQLEPATAAALGVRNIFNPRQNVMAGSRYLAGWLRTFGSAGCVANPDSCPRAFGLALAAYNAGPGAVRRYGGVPPYPATERYVRQVEALYHAYLASS